MLKKEAIRDVRSTTGANMRGILLLMGKTSYDDVTRDNLKDMEFYKVKNEDMSTSGGSASPPKPTRSETARARSR